MYLENTQNRPLRRDLAEVYSHCQAEGIKYYVDLYERKTYHETKGTGAWWM